MKIKMEVQINAQNKHKNGIMNKHKIKYDRMNIKKMGMIIKK